MRSSPLASSHSWRPAPFLGAVRSAPTAEGSSAALATPQAAGAAARVELGCIAPWRVLDELEVTRPRDVLDTYIDEGASAMAQAMAIAQALKRSPDEPGTARLAAALS